MYWREEEKSDADYRVPTDVFDLLFRIRGDSLDIDHAWALAGALQRELAAEVCERIGVLGVRLPESGNGWMRPQQADAALPLSRRARLVIRVRRDDRDAVRALGGRRLSLGAQQLQLGECSTRPLGVSPTLHARAIACDPAQAETDFLDAVANELRAMEIDVGKMICGKAGEIRRPGESLFTRALLVADLKADESIRLQRDGLGGERLVGCGLFLPHKGIDAVYSTAE